MWHQNIGPVKTEESEQILPLDEEMIADLVKWRVETKYAKDGDYIFASPRKKGEQPYWPENLMRNHIRMAARRAGHH